MTAAGGTRSDGRRQAILDAARELFDEHCYDDVNVSMISGRAGMTRTNFYHYYDSKNTVLAAILDDVIRDLMSRTTDVAPRASHESPRRFVARRLSAARAMFERHRRILQLALAQRHDHPGTARIFEERLSAITDDVIAAAGGRRRIPGSDTAALVKMLTVTTTSTLAEPDSSIADLVALERLWVHSLWAENGYVRAAPLSMLC